MEYFKVTSMLNMFADNVQFNQNLSGWCVSSFDSEPNYFSDNSTNFLDINKPVWGTCPP